MGAKRVVVAGGGPAGLAAACLFAQHDWRVVLVAPESAQDPRTVALMQPSLRLLAYLGVWPKQLETVSAPLRKLRLVDETGRLFGAPEMSFSANELGLDAFGWNIPLSNLMPSLTVRGHELGIEFLNATITRTRCESDFVEFETSNGQNLTSSIAIAADGCDSLLRRAAGIAVDTNAYAQTALVTAFSHSASHNGISTERHTPEGPFTTVPLPGNRSSLVWMVKPSHAQQLNSFSDAELATAIQIHSRGELGLIGGIGPRKLFPMSKQIAKRFAANRIFLVGESAHVIPPIGAQGLNLSLRDAAHAVETALAAADDPGGDQALRDYEALRRQDILPRAAAVDAMNQSILLDLLPIHALRAGGLSAVSAIPYLRRLVMSAGIGESTQLPFAMHG